MAGTWVLRLTRELYVGLPSLCWYIQEASHGLCAITVAHRQFCVYILRSIDPTHSPDDGEIFKICGQQSTCDDNVVVITRVVELWALYVNTNCLRWSWTHWKREYKCCFVYISKTTIDTIQSYDRQLFTERHSLR